MCYSKGYRWITFAAFAGKQYGRNCCHLPVPAVHHARFRFYGPLNDFLPLAQRQVEFTHAFWGRPAVKDSIEAIGVPHPEVGLILQNRRPVGFDATLRDGDRISVYPPFRQLELSSDLRLRPSLRQRPRFALDVHLGRLARYLRMLGFDTRYRHDFDDAELAHLAREEARILLTRDHGLLERSLVRHGYFVRATDPERQLVEVTGRFNLLPQAEPLTRCLSCNGLLEPVPKASVADELPPKTRKHFERFYRCTSCQKVYWKGSHYEHMKQRIDRLFDESLRS